VQNGTISDSRIDALTEVGYRPKIAFIGHPFHKKGWKVWRNIVTHDQLSKLYDFYHLGNGGEGHPEKFVPVTVCAEDRHAMVNALIEHGIDIVFLWSIWPETFCYVLYEAKAAGCFLVTHSNSGNVARTVASEGNGVVFKNEEELFEHLSDMNTVFSEMKDFFTQNTHRYILEPQFEVPDLIIKDIQKKKISRTVQDLD
jgi:hypothetical protein